MTIKGYKLEQIVTLLRQIEVEMADGKTTPDMHTGSAPRLAALFCLAHV